MVQVRVEVSGLEKTTLATACPIGQGAPDARLAPASLGLSFAAAGAELSVTSGGSAIRLWNLNFFPSLGSSCSHP